MKNTMIGLLAISISFGAGAAEPTDSLTTPLTHRQMDRADIVANTKVVFASTGKSDAIPPQDSVQSLIEDFYLEQFRQFHDPDAPYFMLMSRDANLALGVGGKMVLRGWYDWHGTQPTGGFFPYDIAIPADPTERRGLAASADNTAVFLTLLGRRNGVHYMVYVQGGVKKKSFVLKKAYVKVNDFTLGLASTTFEDGDALVPTVDAQGPCGQASKSQLLGRYYHTFKNGISVGAGVEFPSSQQDVTDGQTAACNDYIPDVAALVQYSWDGGDSHVRLSGLLRTMSYRNLIASRNHNVVGWGAQLSGCANILHPLKLYFGGIIGKGVGSYQGDLSEGDYDLVGVSGEPGRMEAPLSLGITAGLQYNFSRKVFACVGFGENMYYNKHRLTDDQYRYGIYGTANVFWKITPRFLTGIEYVTGKRVDFDGKHGFQNRIDALLTFSF